MIKFETVHVELTALQERLSTLTKETAAAHERLLSLLLETAVDGATPDACPSVEPASATTDAIQDQRKAADPCCVVEGGHPIESPVVALPPGDLPTVDDTETKADMESADEASLSPTAGPDTRDEAPIEASIQPADKEACEGDAASPETAGTTAFVTIENIEPAACAPRASIAADGGAMEQSTKAERDTVAEPHTLTQEPTNKVSLQMQVECAPVMTAPLDVKDTSSTPRDAGFLSHLQIDTCGSATRTEGKSKHNMLRWSAAAVFLAVATAAIATLFPFDRSIGPWPKMPTLPSERMTSIFSAPDAPIASLD